MLQKLLNRRSCRDFLDKSIELDKIQKIKDVINSSPTARNYQDFSCLFTTNKQFIQQIATLVNQEYINRVPLFLFFYADANRPNSKIAWWKTDATIAASLAMVACEELGLATCLNGLVVHHEQVINQWLHVSNEMKLVIGLAVGYEKTKLLPPQKVNRCYDEKYDLEVVKNGK